MNLVKKLFGWPILMVLGLALAMIDWPWANHWVSYFWLIIIGAVLLAEIVNKIWSPKKQTVSNNIQDEKIDDPIRWWITMVVWMLFAASLVVHFSLKGL